MRKVLLELTEDEARTLYVVTGIFCGSTTDSPRKHVDSVYNTLSRYFCERSCNMPERKLLPESCALMFKNYPTKTPQQIKIEELEATINEAQKQLQELKGL